MSALEALVSDQARPGEAAADETRLVRRVLAGEEDAAEELVRRHADAVWRTGARLLGEGEAARDLAQDVFLRAFRGLASFRGDCSLRSWLLRITVNAARNRRRGWARGRRSRTVPLESPGEEGPPGPVAHLSDPSPGPEREAQSRSLRLRLAAELEALPPEFREAVILRDVEGMDYRSIGRVLGLRAGTVKSRIARAREMLRARLEDLVR